MTRGAKTNFACHSGHIYIMLTIIYVSFVFYSSTESSVVWKVREGQGDTCFCFGIVSVFRCSRTLFVTQTYQLFPVEWKTCADAHTHTFSHMLACLVLAMDILPAVQQKPHVQWCRRTIFWAMFSFSLTHIYWSDVLQGIISVLKQGIICAKDPPHTQTLLCEDFVNMALHVRRVLPSLKLEQFSFITAEHCAFRTRVKPPPPSPLTSSLFIRLLETCYNCVQPLLNLHRYSIWGGSIVGMYGGIGEPVRCWRAFLEIEVKSVTKDPH